MNDDTSQRPAPHRPEQAGFGRLWRHDGAPAGAIVLLGLVVGWSGQLLRGQQAPATKPTTAATVPATAPSKFPATAPATGATTLPATAPATAPAAPPPTPTAIGLAFAAAIERGDAAAAKARAVGEPAHAKWVDATVKLAGSLKKLDAAAVARWGEGGRKVSQNTMGLGEALGALRQAQEKVEGPRATLTQPGGGGPALRLRQGAGGAWRVEAPAQGRALETQLRLYALLSDAAERTAAEVAAGGFANAEEAAAAFARRVLRARVAAV